MDVKSVFNNVSRPTEQETGVLTRICSVDGLLHKRPNRAGRKRRREHTWSGGGREVGGRDSKEAEHYGRRNGVPGELVVRIRPTKVRKAFNLAE